MFGFWSDQAERAVAAGAAVVVPVHDRCVYDGGTRGMVVMVMMVLVIVLDEFQETGRRYGRGRATIVVGLLCGGGGRRTTGTTRRDGSGSSSRSGGRGGPGRWRPDDGRRRRPLDRHAKVDRRGHCDLHRTGRRRRLQQWTPAGKTENAPVRA